MTQFVLKIVYMSLVVLIGTNVALFWFQNSTGFAMCF